MFSPVAPPLPRAAAPAQVGVGRFQINATAANNGHVPATLDLAAANVRRVLASLPRAEFILQRNAETEPLWAALEAVPLRALVDLWWHMSGTHTHTRVKLLYASFCFQARVAYSTSYPSAPASLCLCSDRRTLCACPNDRAGCVFFCLLVFLCRACAFFVGVRVCAWALGGGGDTHTHTRDPKGGLPPNASFLFDESKGTGVVASAWPPPPPHAHFGYAGGLGPATLAAQLPQMVAAVAGSGGGRRSASFWVDMESSLRTVGAFS